MSSPAKLIINCGATHVSASVISHRPGALTLQRFYICDLDYDYSQEEQWMPAAMAAISEAVGQIKGKGLPATFIAPSYQFLTKMIKVPHVEDAKRPQIVAFEAQNQIPHPLHQVVWDYEVLADDGVETEIALVAIKVEIINSFCTELQRMGIVPEKIAAASVLDYNTQRLLSGGTNEDTLVLNIGARTSNLMFVSETGMYIRNINLGGNALTQTIADNLGKRFSEAENLKREYFEGQVFYDEDDPTRQVLDNNRDNFLRRVGQELTRSVVTYRKWKKASAPKKVLLAGNGSLVPGLVDFLRNNQKVEVEFLDPTEALTIDSEVDAQLLEANRYALSETVGEAACLTDKEAASINLLPNELAERIAFQRKKPLLAAAALLLAVATIPPVLHYRAEAEYLDEARQSVEEEIGPLQVLTSDVLANQERAERFEQELQKLEDLVNSKNNWISFFVDLQRQLEDTQDVWLDELKVAENDRNQLNVSGRILIRKLDEDNPEASIQRIFPRIETLLANFEQSEFILDITESEYRPNEEQPRVQDFRFVIELNPERPL